MTKQFLDAQQVFKDAIDRGYLSAKPFTAVYAGEFMYMGTTEYAHEFKHIDSREYYRVPVEGLSAINFNSDAIHALHDSLT